MPFFREYRGLLNMQTPACGLPLHFPEKKTGQQENINPERFQNQSAGLRFGRGVDRPIHCHQLLRSCESVSVAWSTLNKDVS